MVSIRYFTSFEISAFLSSSTSITRPKKQVEDSFKAFVGSHTSDSLKWNSRGITKAEFDLTNLRCHDKILFTCFKVPLSGVGCHYRKVFIFRFQDLQVYMIVAKIAKLLF